MYRDLSVYKTLYLRNRKLYIAVGGDDNDPNDPDISSTHDHQGIHRVERAQNYFEASRIYAIQKSIPFNWELKITGSGGNSRFLSAFPLSRLLQITMQEMILMFIEPPTPAVTVFAACILKQTKVPQMLATVSAVFFS